MGEHFVVVFLFFFDMEFFVLEIRNRTTHGPIIQNQLVLRVSCLLLVVVARLGTFATHPLHT
jgi:hypothetical protein